MTAHPDSFPFILAEAPVLVETDYVDADDDVEVTVPARVVALPASGLPASESSRNVPPRAPPAPLRVVGVVGEDLPTVIVDLGDYEVGAEIDAQRARDVDGLLSVKLDFPIEPKVPLRPTGLSVVTITSPRRSAVSFHLRGLAVALVAAITAAGGTLAGFRALHITGPAGVAVSHLTR